MKLSILLCVMLVAVVLTDTVVATARAQHKHIGHPRPLHKRKAQPYRMKNPSMQQQDDIQPIAESEFFHYYEEETVPGAVYTRWGRTECGDMANLVYKGIVAGTRYIREGGGANYLCLVEDPSYYNEEIYESYDFAFSSIYQAEYQYPLRDNANVKDGDDIPCAVCEIDRTRVFTVQGKHTCPDDDTWTLEYSGYLMTSKDLHAHSTTFECVDKDMEAIPGSIARRNYDGALLYHISPYTRCEFNALCPLYGANRPITCAVCSK